MEQPDPRAKFWDRIANRYARSQMRDPQTYEKKLAMTQRFLGPEMAVLEVGCGTGSTALAHAPHVGRIHATDVSPRMIEIAKEKAKQQGIENARFEVATLERLAGSGPYDAVLALNLLHLLEDLEGSLASIHSLIKPDGLFISSTPCLEEGYGWLKYVAPLGRAVGLMPKVAFFTGDELVEAIHGAGFATEDAITHGNGMVRFHVCRRLALDVQSGAELGDAVERRA